MTDFKHGVWYPKTMIPPRQENVSYSQVWCLCYYKGEQRILAFNHEHMVWDREDGDDYFCAINEVSAWMPLPENPVLPLPNPPEEL